MEENIYELIERLCPEGVEYRRLGEVAKIYTGTQLNKTDMIDGGEYPVVNGGISYSGYTSEYNETEDTVTVSQGGASAGFVNWIKEKFWLGAHCYAVHPDKLLNNRFLYFALKNQEETIMGSKQGAGIPGLNGKQIRNIEIPVPPMEVQQEVVRILDKFTALQAELQAELQARKKQYEYYRDKLLTFSHDDPNVV